MSFFGNTYVGVPWTKKGFLENVRGQRLINSHQTFILGQRICSKNIIEKCWKSTPFNLYNSPEISFYLSNKRFPTISILCICVKKYRSYGYTTVKQLIKHTIQIGLQVLGSNFKDEIFRLLWNSKFKDTPQLEYHLQSKKCIF